MHSTQERLKRDLLLYIGSFAPPAGFCLPKTKTVKSGVRAGDQLSCFLSSLPLLFLLLFPSNPFSFLEIHTHIFVPFSNQSISPFTTLFLILFSSSHPSSTPFDTSQTSPLPLSTSSLLPIHLLFPTIQSHSFPFRFLFPVPPSYPIPCPLPPFVILPCSLPPPSLLFPLLPLPIQFPSSPISFSTFSSSSTFSPAFLLTFFHTASFDRRRNPADHVTCAM